MPLEDPKLEALQLFTRRVVRERGRVTDAMTEEFLHAGWGPQQVLEVVLGVAIKTMSNYTNAIVDVPLEAMIKPDA